MVENYVSRSDYLKLLKLETIKTKKTVNVVFYHFFLEKKTKILTFNYFFQFFLKKFLILLYLAERDVMYYLVKAKGRDDQAKNGWEYCDLWIATGSEASALDVWNKTMTKRYGSNNYMLIEIEAHDKNNIGD